MIDVDAGLSSITVHIYIRALVYSVFAVGLLYSLAVIRIVRKASLIQLTGFWLATSVSAAVLFALFYISLQSREPFWLAAITHWPMFADPLAGASAAAWLVPRSWVERTFFGPAATVFAAHLTTSAVSGYLFMLSL